MSRKKKRQEKWQYRDNRLRVQDKKDSDKSKKKQNRE